MNDQISRKINVTETSNGAVTNPALVSRLAGGGVCVVGIGASAGGLDACQRLLAAMSHPSGMAFILIQHLDPTHESLMVELLSKATTMPVCQATDGMVLENDHLYVIPPGAYLSFRAGALHLSEPLAKRGARLPFDFLLQSLAVSVGSRAICVILSGSGSDGTVGLKAIKAAGGLVIAQSPDDAAYDGMPRSAIASGGVDIILPVEEIAQELLRFRQRQDALQSTTGASRIVALLREKTSHDFTLYKPGTLERRIAHRMTLAGISADDTDRYFDILKQDAKEREQLVDDLLINVTSFFRDPKVFEALALTVIPEIVSSVADQAIRIWIAGCSTGEETYSLAMLVQEQILAVRSTARVQMFASDVDEKAVSIAREGFYPNAIEQTVSAERLERFFVKQGDGYQVTPELRSTIVFAVQDVLADPPFSRLDLISCRNLLIYLQPQAQAKVISIFHFALRPNGTLLLGSAEAVNALDARFSVISKQSRLYRKTGLALLDQTFSIPGGEVVRMPSRISPEKSTPGSDIAEFCKRLILENYAPAVILINERFECLYSAGPTDPYLRAVQGYPTQDLQAMIKPALRARLKSAVAKAGSEDVKVVVPGGRAVHEGQPLQFDIEVTPVRKQNDRLFLVCFSGHAKHEYHDHKVLPAEAAHGPARHAEIEQELREARAEIASLTQSLGLASQEQHAINEEAMSINEEFQSTNEELVTSKEELQSLNEELTVLNSQLQETLERSRTTSNDLQNVLYSTDVATLFLDEDLNIRFFTPAAKALFTVIASDLGRPLSDLHSLASDSALQADAMQVLKTFKPIERDVEAQNGDWFNRRVLPYRTHDESVAGVVITFTDITQRKKIKNALKAAQLVAERANIAKSRFMAAASHDLRQPLQTLTLLNALLAKITGGAQAQKLLHKIDETTNSMGEILGTLLDINQIEAGVVKAEMQSFPINALLQKLGEEFAFIAESRGLTLHTMPCNLHVYTDPKLLEQIIRNLLSNALKYTKKGGVVLGCRRGRNTLRIEVWDSGSGIPKAELKVIFDEYHQVESVARDRSRGLGLGLSIVQRLSEILGHPVSVRSTQGRGSVFSIEVAISTVAPPAAVELLEENRADAIFQPDPLIANILIIEDDTDIRHLLEMFLIEEGHVIAAAQDGDIAIKLVGTRMANPDLVIVDYNLPNGTNGLQVISELRRLNEKPFSVIVCTGDISAETIRRIAAENCAHLSKPMKLKDLNDTIQRLLGVASMTEKLRPMNTSHAHQAGQQTVYIIDDDPAVGSAMRLIFEANCFQVEVFADCEAFWAAPRREANSCLLVDANLPGMSGIEMLQKLASSRSQLPAILMTGEGDVKMAVQAMKAGAFDFIEKPVSQSDLLKFVKRVFEQSRDSDAIAARRGKAAEQIASLTSRQRQVMDMVLAGHPSKNIAADLGISQRTVENHRASIMERTQTRSIPALARLAIMASGAMSGTD
jgi:two-component system CheB/CheR fusion protein